MMLKYGSFPLTAIFSLLLALRFEVFTDSKFHNYGWKNDIDFWFSPICSTDILYKVVY